MDYNELSNQVIFLHLAKLQDYLFLKKTDGKSSIHFFPMKNQPSGK